MKRNHTLLTVLALLLNVTAALGGPAPAVAAPLGQTFIVNVTIDGKDKTPGDGQCETDTGNGLCTVRAAIMEANAQIGDDIVELPGDLLLLTIGGANEDGAETGDLDITHNLTIVGAGAASTRIDGNHLDRVLHIFGDATVAITGVTIQHGLIAGSGSFTNYGGGIFNSGTLTLNDSVVRENSYSGAISGGGIHNEGSLTVNNSTIAGNTARNGAGIHNFQGTLTVNDSLVTGNTAETGCGGGIYNAYYGAATVNGTTVNDNTAGGNCGGGFFNSSGTLTLSASLVTDNKALSSGGGIHNNDILYVYHSTIAGNQADSNNDGLGNGGGVSNVAGEVVIADSTLSGNMARHGGGVSNGYYDSTFTLTNSTVSGNRANGHGGGIYTDADPGDVVVTSLYNVTVTDNTADYDQADGGDGGGIYIQSGTTVNLSNSIVARNFDASPSLLVLLKPHDCAGALSSAGSNLLGNNFGCSGLTNGQNGDQVGAGFSPLNPLLGPLQYNGGPTQTHALLAGSPAIDGGNPGGCADGLNQSLTTDQRGFARTLDGDGVGGPRCDIGAFEFTQAFFQVFVPIVVK